MNTRNAFSQLLRGLMVVTLLAGCGGGGGGDGSTAPPVSSCVPVKGGNDSIDGGGAGGGGGGGGGAGGAGSEGAIQGADVRLLDSAGNLLGTAVSDAKGLVTLNPCGKTGPFLVEFVGNDTARYFDEGIATKNLVVALKSEGGPTKSQGVVTKADADAAAWVPFGPGEKISAYVPDLEQGLVVSPLTNAAAEEVKRSGVTPTVDVLNAANEKVRAIFNAQFAGSGVGVEDITKVPSIVYSVASLRSLNDDPRGRYAQMLASLAKAATQFNSELPNPARQMTKQLTLDLSDGVIDGKDSTGAAVAPPASRAYDWQQLPAALVAQTAGRLTRLTTGSGTVTISSSTGSVPCPSGTGDCFAWGSKVTLSAQPAAGWVFQGWSACAGTGPCQLTMSGDKEVTATFSQQTASRTLSVQSVGTGKGSFVSAPAGISCAGACSAAYSSGTAVTVTATPDAGSTFDGWSGACTGKGSCTVTMDEDRSVTATFTSAPGKTTLTVAIARTGASDGTVAPSPAGTSCGQNCYSYDAGTAVTLTASPAAGSKFTGWTGACAGTGTCAISMSASRSVTAAFAEDAPETFSLAVGKSGAGSGTVTPSPAGTSCGQSCFSYAAGASVALTASPAAGSTFAGWSGACTGTGSCVVTMDAAKSVTATFALTPAYPLTIATAGAGSGTVAPSPIGTSCGLNCREYAAGTAVTLAANPAAGSTFAGWSGACTGVGACSVTMDAARSVTATFATVNTVLLSVAKNGTGLGTVSSAPAGIACGASCSASYAEGTLVSLTAIPTVGSTFTGWSGACTGTGSCAVTMDAAKSVTATFTISTFTLSVTKVIIGDASGTVSSSPAGISCGSTCAASYDAGTQVVLIASPAPGSTFTGWSGACTGTGSCSVSIDAAKRVTATFEPEKFVLTVTVLNSGAGTISSVPAGIVCGVGQTCTASYTAGTVVWLFPAADPGSFSVFDRFVGPCEIDINTSCPVTMDAAKSVTARFNFIILL